MEPWKTSEIYRTKQILKFYKGAFKMIRNLVALLFIIAPSPAWHGMEWLGGSRPILTFFLVDRTKWNSFATL